jgi:O-antigen/teichoic acid export membrane protein
MNHKTEKLVNTPILNGSTFNAGFWVLASQVGTQTMRLLTSILLTRLLSPDAFGLIAIAMTLVTAIYMVSDLGLRQIIVTSENAGSPLFLDTIWTLQILRGLAVFVLALLGAAGLFFSKSLFGFAPAGVYSDPALPVVLAFIGVSALVLGFESTGVGTAIRGTNLGRMTAVDILTAVISALITLGLAYFYRSVWPLVIGNLAGAATRVILSRRIFSDHINQIRLNKQYVTEILSFSKWIFASSAMGFVVNNADKLAFSMVMTTTKFGTVTIAISLLGVLLDTINRLIENVVFPKFRQATQSNDPSQLTSTFQRFRLVLDSAVFFLTAFIWFASDSIVRLLFDHRYQEAAEYLRILSFTQLWLIASCCSSLGLALGESNLLARVTSIRLILTFVFPVIGYRIAGDIGIAWALVAAQIPAVVYAVVSARRLLGETGIGLKTFQAGLAIPFGGLCGYVASSVLH